jgi:hypothetical protein
VSRARADRGAVVVIAALAACHAPAARAPRIDDRLWRAATEVVGDGRGHLPLPATALVAQPGGRALAITEDGGLAEVDLATAEVVRARFGEVDGQVRAAAALPDGRVLAVGDRDGRAAAWWIAPAGLAARAIALAGAHGPITGVAVARDGAIVLTGPDWPLALYDPRILAERALISPTIGWQAPAFVGDYVAATRGGALIVFDPGHDARPIGRIPGVGFVSPDGAAVLVNTDSGDATLIDLHGAGGGEPDLGTAPIAAVAWSPSGERAALIRADRIELVELPSGRRRPLPIPSDGARAVFGRDGATLLVSRGGGLWRVDPSGAVTGPGIDGTGIAEVAPGAAVSDLGWRALAPARPWQPWPAPAAVVAVSPGGARVAMIGADHVVRVTDVARGAPVPGPDRGVLDEPIALAIDDRGAALVGGWSTLTRVADGVATPRVIGEVTVLALDLARGRAVTARGGAITVVPVEGGAPIARASAPGCRSDARAWLAADGAALAITGGRVIERWDLARAVRTGGFALPGPARAVGFAGGRVLIAVRDQLLIWDGPAVAAVATVGAVTAIAADGDAVMLGFGDGRIARVSLAALVALAAPITLPEPAAPRRCPGAP